MKVNDLAAAPWAYRLAVKSMLQEVLPISWAPVYYGLWSDQPWRWDNESPLDQAAYWQKVYWTVHALVHDTPDVISGGTRLCIRDRVLSGEPLLNGLKIERWAISA